MLRTREMKNLHVFSMQTSGSAVAPTIPCMISASPRTATILTRWGEDRIVERLVRAYREERPDINSTSSMCPGSTATTGP